jgi:hypothetical protein
MRWCRRCRLTELAVETAVTVRDKVVEAYQEILRMPVMASEAVIFDVMRQALWVAVISAPLLDRCAGGRAGGRPVSGADLGAGNDADLRAEGRRDAGRLLGLDEFHDRHAGRLSSPPIIPLIAGG